MRRYLFLSSVDYPLLGVRRPFAAWYGHEPDPVQVLPVRDRVRDDVLRVTVFSSCHLASYSPPYLFLAAVLRPYTTMSRPTEDVF